MTSLRIGRVAVNGQPRVAIFRDGPRLLPTTTSLESILDSESPIEEAERVLPSAELASGDWAWLAPVERQEVWAAGVTYLRSQAARMEESETAADCYDRVYRSPRPELFLKATPHRVSGHLSPLRIRQDSQWNVPEPEVTLVVNSRGKWVGLTIGNDMSSRDIEGDNPLYLPQAKVYNQCAGVGPWITLFNAAPDPATLHIRLSIERNGAEVFAGATDCGKMARSFPELLEWLHRDNAFPHGVLLMTGTGVVPDNDFTLQPGDITHIDVDGLGRLSNPTVQGDGG